MSSGYHYKAFGLNILSDQPIQSLNETPSLPHDIRIELGVVDDRLNLDQNGGIKREWHANTQRFLLDVDGVARFRVSGGCKVRIERALGAKDSDIVAYLLGSVFAAILQQRRLLTLHASAIDTPRGAVLFLGKSGAGKSTLLACMLLRGYVMISDDISTIDLDTAGFGMSGVPTVRPAFPTLRLSQNAMTGLGQDTANLASMGADKDKFLLPVDSFCKTPRPLNCTFLLSSRDQSGIELQSLSFAQQFQSLAQFTFRKNYYSGHGLEQFHFDAVSKIAQHNKLSLVIRPSETFKIHQLADRIEQALL